MTSFSIQNFGCRVNQAEAFAWAEAFERRGLVLEPDAARADLVVINSCTLTGRADRDVRKFIRRVARLNPQARLVIAGCSVERDRDAMRAMPQAWLVLSNEEKPDLPERVAADFPARPAAGSHPLRSRALLKVQDGCDNRCSFCVIPTVRGGSRSLDPGGILDRARDLTDRGFREIVLCGIHLSSYGGDLVPRRSLAGLLRELTAVPGLGRVRLSSFDPRALDEELIHLITGDPGICPHFHLSLQHASENVLRRMGRNSRTADYAGVLGKLRALRPDAALGADIIVGFPGESEADFEDLRGFLQASPLNYFHVFAFSPRPGTAAAAWPQVGEADKRRRSAVLRSLSAGKRQAFEESFVGRELGGVVVKSSGGSAVVLTGNYINVRVPAGETRPGASVTVRVEEAGRGRVRGVVVG
ncbi:MAG: radical SAM protein [Candidatus Aminicenantes bacterium RBG_16_63_16]|nr:MAG: radical SAM protein [Candidatus Aminicenantes bacterium RBG_16_63_16]